MKPKRNVSAGMAFILLYAIAFFFFLLRTIRPELYFFAQQPPFQANMSFFSSYLSFPGGLSMYATNFLMQLFTVNWAGSLVITLGLLVLLLLAWPLAADGDRSAPAFLAMFIPAMLFFALVANYYFPFTAAFAIFLVYACTGLTSTILRAGKAGWLAWFFLAPLLYYVAGGSSLFLYAASVLIFVIARAEGIKRKSLIAALVIATAVLMPFLSYKYLFHIPFSNAFFEYYPTDSLLAGNYERNWIFYAFFYSAPCLVLFRELAAVWRKKKNASAPEKQKKGNVAGNAGKTGPAWYHRYAVLFACLLIAILTLAIGKVNFPVRENKIVQANFYCAHKKWDKVLDLIRSEKEYDVMFNYFYNRAIDHSGHYLDLYFGYPQYIGPAGTDPEKADFGILYMYNSDYYYDLGYISESQRWAYKALVGFPYCPRILERLVLNNIIEGRYRPAEKFLAILDDNLVSDRFVNKYSAMLKDTTLIASDAEIMGKRADMPFNRVTPQDIAWQYKVLLEKNRENKRAYEHMQMNFLLSHDLVQFYTNLPLGMDYYKVLPEVFQEALIILRTRQVPVDASWQIEESTMRTFQDFFRISRANAYDNARAKKMLGKYKNTLYYYILYDSPRVTGMALNASEEGEYHH